MKTRKKFIATLLALLLMLSASGCSKSPPVSISPEIVADDAAPTPEDTAQSAPLSMLNETTESTSTVQEEQEENTGPLLEEGHFLTYAKTNQRIDLPPLLKEGLELPVNGATGYASVELPLWEELPGEDDTRTLLAIDARIAEIEEERISAEEAAAEDATEEELSEEDSSVEETAKGEQETEQNNAEEASSQADGEEPSAAQNEISANAQDMFQSEDTWEPGDVSESTDTDQPVAEDETNGEFGGMPEDTVEMQNTETDPNEPAGDDTAEAEAEGKTEDEAEDETEGEPDEHDLFKDAIAMLQPGAAFTVLEESGEWWLISSTEGTGWIEHRYCFVNLPDVVPSIIYNATNSYSSLFVSCGKALPHVTGRALYPGVKRNDRFGRDEFMMPMLYAMAKNVCRAQHAALAEGNTLVLYEAYRPYETQRTVLDALNTLCRDNAKVRSAVSDPPWNISWFIASGYSNHQRGFAMDVSLAKVTQAELRSLDGYEYVKALEYEEYKMPTTIHELSRAAATFTAPVPTFSRSAWRSAKMTEAMASNRPALALQRYCTGTGDLAPLASEWWHFNDLSAREAVIDHMSVGDYQIRECRSISVSEAHKRTC